MSVTREQESPAAGFTPPSIAAGGLDAFIFRGIEVLSATLLVVVTGRLMEPAGRGLYALASLTVSLLVLPLGPVWVGNAVEMTRRRLPLAEILGGSLVIAAAGGVLTGLVALAVTPLLGDRWWLVALPAVVTPFLLLTKYEEGIYTALGHVRAVNLARIARVTLPLVFITPPLLAGASPRTAILVWTLSFVVLPVIVFVPLRRLVGRPRRPRDRGFYRRVVVYGGKITALNAADTVNDRVGLLALAIFATDATVGVFSIAVAAVQVLLLATYALALSAFRRIGTGSPEVSAALTSRTIRHAVALTGMGSLALVPVAFVGIPLALGDGYEDVALLLAVLVPYAISVAVLTQLYSYFEVQARRPVTLVRIALCALAANLALALVLAPEWGAWGVAVAASVSGVIGAGAGLRAFTRGAGARPADLLPGAAELRDYRALGAAVWMMVRRRAAGREERQDGGA